MNIKNVLISLIRFFLLYSLLAIAAFSGAKSIVEFLINKKAQINQMDLINSRTALHWAVASRNYEISKMLIEAG